MYRKEISKYNSLFTVDTDGRVFNTKTGYEYKQRLTTNGYMKVGTTYKYKPLDPLVHRLVALQFIDNPENKPQVNHINGDKTDNRVENLEWVTEKENTNHATATGLRVQHGENSHFNKYTEDSIKLVCELLQDGLRYKDISLLTGVSVGIICLVKNNMNWKYISKDYVFPKKSKRISLNTIEWICHMLQSGESPEFILTKTTNKHITLDFILSVLYRQSFQYISKKYDFSLCSSTIETTPNGGRE